MRKFIFFGLLASIVGVFAQTSPFIHPEVPASDPVGYNAPASILIDAAWDFHTNVAFIYWYSSQDALDVAYSAPTLAGVAGQVLYPVFQYEPGFKVGLGIDTHSDDWTINLEYTWLYQSESSTTISPSGYSAANWFAPSGSTLGLFAVVGSIWGFHLDILDLMLGRPFYQGRNVTFSPSFGIRGLTLHQGLGVTMAKSLTGSPTATYTGHSHSWAVGPKAAVNTHWMIWKGFRIESLVGASLLYTNYLTINNSQVQGLNSTSSDEKNTSALRPILDMGLGLGYGAYVFKNKFYLDLTARYDFSQYWAQNVIRTYASQLGGTGNDIGDLRMHGLTLDLRCDF
jgi:hypothetical protein